MRVLIVEDEIKLGNAVKRALELQKYAVDIAYDGEAGLDLASSETFDLIILDLNLPKIDGLEVCRQLRQSHLPTPILILTARGQISDKVTCLDVGADDYLVKPFSFEELFARVRALLRRQSSDSDPLLTFDQLSLNPATFKVIRENKTISLSAKEFSILEYLMRHSNQIVTKEQIINHVWNYEAEVLPNAIEVHIKHLRDKVDQPFTYPLIHTIRGFGYQLKGR